MSLFSPSQPSAPLRARTLVLAVPRHHLTFICLLQHRQPLTPAPATVEPNFACLPGNRRAAGPTAAVPRALRSPAAVRAPGAARRERGSARGSARLRVQGSGLRSGLGAPGPVGAVLSAVLNRLPLGLPPCPILRAPGSVRSPPHGSHEGPATSLAACHGSRRIRPST